MLERFFQIKLLSAATTWLFWSNAQLSEVMGTHIAWLLAYPSGDSHATSKSVARNAAANFVSARNIDRLTVSIETRKT